MSVEVAQRPFTVSEYYRMAEVGILSEDDRVELIEGKIVAMSPIGSRHAASARRLNALLNRLVDQAAVVSVQNPIRLDEYSEPQPDLALLRQRHDFYAQAQIPEVWLVSLSEGQVKVYADPVGDAYQDVREAKPGDTLNVGAMPSLAVAVDEILE